MPFEFETDEHFLKDASGTDIEPIAQEPDGVIMIMQVTMGMKAMITALTTHMPGYHQILQKFG